MYKGFLLNPLGNCAPIIQCWCFYDCYDFTFTVYFPVINLQNCIMNLDLTYNIFGDNQDILRFIICYIRKTQFKDLPFKFQKVHFTHCVLYLMKNGFCFPVSAFSHDWDFLDHGAVVCPSGKTFSLTWLLQPLFFIWLRHFLQDWMLNISHLFGKTSTCHLIKDVCLIFTLPFSFQLESKFLHDCTISLNFVALRKHQYPDTKF